MVANTPAQNKSEPQPRRERDDAAYKRRMRRGGQAFMAAVAAATPGAVSAEEAAFNAFTQGATFHQVQSIAPNIDVPPTPQAPAETPGQGRFACIEISNQDRSVTTILIANADRVAYRTVDTSTPYGQADVDALPCQTADQYADDLNKRMRQFVDATADYIEEHEAKAGLSSPAATVMRNPAFTANPITAHARTASMFNNLNNAIRQRRGQAGFDALVDQEKHDNLISQFQGLAIDLEIMKNVTNSVPALQEQLNLGDLRPGDNSPPPPLWDRSKSVPASFDPDTLSQWRANRASATAQNPAPAPAAEPRRLAL